MLLFISFKILFMSITLFEWVIKMPFRNALNWYRNRIKHSGLDMSSKLDNHFICLFRMFQGFPGGSVVKNLPPMQETWAELLHWEEPPRRRAWQLTLVFLPGESHGQRSLVGYGPWGGKSWTQVKWLNNIVDYTVVLFSAVQQSDSVIPSRTLRTLFMTV